MNNFKYSDNNIDIKLGKLDKIGSGSYGIVYKTNINGKGYALKQNLVDSTVSFNGSVRELDLLMRLNHQNIVNIEYIIYGSKWCPKQKLDYETVNDNIHFVFDMGLYDMHKLIYGYKKGEEFLRLMMADILLGIDYIHKRNIVHRDIKPSNILIYEMRSETGKKYRAKICDLGLAKSYTLQGKQSPRVITCCYRAPEVMIASTYDHKVDIWSIGCVFYEMVTRKRLILSLEDNKDNILGEIRKQLNDAKIPQYIQNVNIMDYKKEFLEQLVDLLPHLLEMDPSKRYSADSALHHPFFDPLRPYINSVLEKNKPKQIEHVLKISTSMYRKQMSSFYIKIFNNFSSNELWYKYRIFFQAIDIADRFILWLDKTNSNFDESTFQFYLYIILYLSIKYFSCTNVYPEFNSICFEKQFLTIKKLEEGLQFETFLIEHVLKFRIYRPTIYEGMDSKGIHMNYVQVNKLLDLYLNNHQFLEGKAYNQIDIHHL